MNSEKNVNEILREKREALGLSMQEVSNKTGISISHISRIEKGVRSPGYKIFEKLNELYSSENEFSFKNEGNVLKESAFLEIPLIRKIQANISNQIEAYLKIPIEQKNKIDFALRMSDDSMSELNIKKDDIVFIKQQATVENGEVAVILIDKSDAVIIQFYNNGDNVTLIPKSKSSNHIPLVYNTLESDIKVIGKVVSAYINI